MNLFVCGLVDWACICFEREKSDFSASYKTSCLVKKKKENGDVFVVSVTVFQKPAVKSGTPSSMRDSGCSSQNPSSGTPLRFFFCFLNFLHRHYLLLLTILCFRLNLFLLFFGLKLLLFTAYSPFYRLAFKREKNKIENSKPVLYYALADFSFCYFFFRFFLKQLL